MNFNIGDIVQFHKTDHDKFSIGFVHSFFQKDGQNWVHVKWLSKPTPYDHDDASWSIPFANRLVKYYLLKVIS